MKQDIMQKTMAYFGQPSVSGLMQFPGRSIATMALRFGIAVALRHPEYAQAYHQLTKGIAPEADEVEDKVIDDFVKAIPLSTTTPENGELHG